MSNPTQLDPVSAAVSLAAFLLGSQAAADLVGPYSIIVCAAFLGAGFGASGGTQSGGGWTFAKIFGSVLLAVLGTVPVCLMIEHYTTLEARWLFAGIAFLIGFRSRQIPADVTRGFHFITGLAAGWLRWKFKDPQEPPK